MKRELLLFIAVAGLMIGWPNLRQRAFAQILPGPTVDDRFRDAGDKEKSPAAELPLLNPQQSKSIRDSRQPNKSNGPAFLGVTFNTDIHAPIVKSVTPGSPAEQAGLQPTDVIETIQGWPVKTYQDVLDVVAKTRPGELLDIEFSRRLSVRTQVALTILPADKLQSVGYPPDERIGSEHELLPTPAKAQAKYNNPAQRSNGNGKAAGQRPGNFQDNNPQDDRRGLRGRFRSDR
jgi:membrane-associated protease RseP (regulator of RpoE activity)